MIIKRILVIDKDAKSTEGLTRYLPYFFPDATYDVSAWTVEQEAEQLLANPYDLYIVGATLEFLAERPVRRIREVKPDAPIAIYTRASPGSFDALSTACDIRVFQMTEGYMGMSGGNEGVRKIKEMYQ